MNVLNKMKSILLSVILIFLSFPSVSVVLDWTGSYEWELNALYKSTVNSNSGGVFHNLLLKPDIKPFDGVHIKTWLQLSSDNSASPVSTNSVTSTNSVASPVSVNKNFYLQKGSRFGINKNKGFVAPFMLVRDLYLEINHNFGFFQLGWKPHNFGLGMYYNNATRFFSPIYNLEGGTGFVSWRGFIKSSYYVQGMVHYINQYLFNIFFQGGFSTKSYGIEGMYKTLPIGIKSEDNTEDFSYIGVYGYYDVDNINIQAEVGKTSQEVYGGVLDVQWKTPIKRLDMGINIGVSTFNNSSAFYFDPSFSYHLSSFIAQYEGLKSTDYLKKYLGYSFHSAISIAPSVSVLLLESLNIETIYSTHFKYLTFERLLSDVQLILKYELAKQGLVLKVGAGVLFPKQDDFYLGIISQAAITF